MEIKNAATDTSELSIYGDIGEDWFGDGHTMNSLKDQLSEISTANINVRISSLGGDVDDGLVMYNLLRTNAAHVTTFIEGMTASAGTIVALGGDRVEIDENALFLVHNAWTLTMGNADELRKTAEDMDKIDAALINIYKKQTGKRKSQIKSLMAEEKWLTADEAKEFGFVDAVIPTKLKAAASVKSIKGIEGLITEKKLPEIPTNYINKLNEMTENKEEAQGILENIKAAMGFKNDAKLKEELKASQEEVTTLKAKIDELEGDTDQAKLLETAENDLKEANTKVEASAKEVETLQTSISEYDTKVAALQAEIEEANSKVIGDPPSGKSEAGKQNPGDNEEPQKLTASAQIVQNMIEENREWIDINTPTKKEVENV
jgi:ATP-dependent Clp protease protease subunit